MRFRFWLLLLICVSALGGCVRRRMTVRSNPPGATVFIDGQEIGRTPVATSFTYYGTRNFRLVKDGYETISVNQRFPAPWYQVPPLDFFSENLAPQEIRDEHVVNFDLAPKANVSMDDVLIHAEQLRNQVRPIDQVYGVPGVQALESRPQATLESQPQRHPLEGSAIPPNGSYEEPSPQLDQVPPELWGASGL